jgi:two-component system sensor histidine kinase KdpD
MGAVTSIIDYGDKIGPSVRSDLLGQIRLEAENLDQMVRNLLAVTRIDAGALELRWDWIDLREIAERVVSAARRRGALQAIETKWSADLPLIRADAALVEQAFGNVVSNAIAHTPPATNVVIDALVTADWIALRITDDGPGIPREALSRIFEKFARGEAAGGRKEGGEGTGLGLTIAKGILDAHGGSITAESPGPGGKGARFVLSFPRAEVPA